MKKPFLIFCCAFFFLQQLQAQTTTYHVQVIADNNMVSPGEIIQLLKDDKGFLWLLSPTKVQRYDGKNFISFSFDDRCISIQQDAEGTIWLASRQNIYRFKNDYKGFENIANLKSDSVQYLAMVSGPGKKIYLRTKNDIRFWSPQTKSFDKLDIKPLNNNSSFPFLKSAGHFLYYQQSDSVLVRYNTLDKTIDEVPVYRGSFLFLVNEDTAWVRQSIRGSALVSFKTKKVIPVNSSQFSETFDNNLFFVTGSSNNFSFISFNDNGYYSYDAVANRFKRIKLLYNGLPLAGNQPINSFYQEENGTIWFSNEEGLIYLNPAADPIGLLRSNVSHGENWNNNVRSITEDKEGNIWFGTANGFCRMDIKNGTVKTWLPKFESNNYLNYNSVRSIGYSNGKIIVLQSEKGCWIFDPETGLFKRPGYESEDAKKGFEGGFNSNMIKLKNGNFLLLSNAVWLLHKGDFKIQRVNITGFDPLPRSGFEDIQGRIWFVGGNGIFCCNSDFKLLYSNASKELGRWANAIVQLDENTFWMASKTLFELKSDAGGKLTTTPIFPELKEAHFSNLYKDSLKRIWMFSDKGIYRYVPEKKLLELFDQKNNAQPYYVGISNHFRAGNGILYAGSTNGINYFTPEKISVQADSLKIHLLNVSVNKDDTSYQINKKLPKLKYFQNSMVFEFNAPYIYNGDKIVYRCRLQGADKDWVFLDHDNSVRYSSVQPGRYTFYIAASLNGEDWYEMEQPFTFTISPPFWQQWWFIAVIAIVAFGSVVYLFKRKARSAKINLQSKEKELEVIRLSHDLAASQLTVLRTQMNPHFIFNALNSVQQYILQGNVIEANKYLSKFSKLQREILHYSSHNFISLEKEIEILDSYLQLEQLRFGESFTYVISTHEDIDPAEIKIPPMMLQPFVENAIWHGLMPKQGERNLKINFNFFADDILLATIRDNGIGRKASEQLKQNNHTNAGQHESKGMSLVQQRMMLLQLQYDKPFESSISDITDENGLVLGTEVILKIFIGDRS